jgi:hypothetical protein
MKAELRTVLLCGAALAAAGVLAAAQPAAPPAAQAGRFASAQPAAPPAEQPGEPPVLQSGEPSPAPAPPAPAPPATPASPPSPASPTSPAAFAPWSGARRSEMPALLGPTPASRESSGTSWQPESSPYEGLFRQSGPWWMMVSARALVSWDDQEGPRGSLAWFSANAVEGTATRPLGPGRLGLRAVLSAEPLTVGRDGYPLLMQTGQTANGRTPLVDHQAPQDLFEELAATYSVGLERAGAVFLYAGLPGNPALGPPFYMDRFSGMNNPEAPLSYHWLDSTHTSYGVTTLGWILGELKAEASAFRGREPDQYHADLESPDLDSYALRVSLEPDPGLAVQGSFGHLKSPEELAPGIDVDRSTVSVIYNTPLAEAGNLQTTFAWGRDKRRPGRTTNAYLFEGAAAFLTRHTVFYRLESVENDELVQDVFGDLLLIDRRGPPVASISKVGGGYVYDLLVGEGYRTGLGFDVSVVHVPQRLEFFYGSDWVPGWMLFLRFRLGNALM